MSEVVEKAMARLTSVKNDRKHGRVLYSYIPNRLVYLAGDRDGLTQEQFREKANASRKRVGELFLRMATPKGPGYMKIRKEACAEIAKLMPDREAE